MGVEPRPSDNWPAPVTKQDRLNAWQKSRSQKDRQEYTEAQRARLQKLHEIEVEDTAEQLRREDERENRIREARGLPPI